jgi:hypothetical protein
MKTTWILEVNSDVYAGRANNEDYERRDELCYYVQAENARGDRFAHFFSFTTEKYNREVCEAKAAHLMSRIQKAMDAGKWKGPVNNEHWRRARPVYGSEAYIKGDGAFEDGLAEAQAFGEEAEFLSSQW